MQQQEVARQDKGCSREDVGKSLRTSQLSRVGWVSPGCFDSFLEKNASEQKEEKPRELKGRLQTALDAGGLTNTKVVYSTCPGTGFRSKELKKLIETTGRKVGEQTE